MFDIGFFEILLVSVVALLVLGPERLPGAVRTAGLWIGRLKRSFNNVKRDIEKEIGADDIRRQLRNEAIMEKLGKTKTQFTQTIDSVKTQAESIKSQANSVKESVTKDLDLSKQFDAVTGAGQSKSEKPEETPSISSSDPATEATTPGVEATPEDSPKTTPPKHDETS